VELKSVRTKLVEDLVSVIPTLTEDPAATDRAVTVAVGRKVSYKMLSVVLAVLLLPAASVNLLAGTEIVAVPLELAAGVKVAV
jgi:hypothetical protein